jgi:hypothetical protein
MFTNDINTSADLIEWLTSPVDATSKAYNQGYNDARILIERDLQPKVTHEDFTPMDYVEYVKGWNDGLKKFAPRREY